MRTCTCGADGMPPGAHESFCDLLTGRNTAAEEQAEADRAHLAAQAASRDLFGVDDPWAVAS